ncbi:MAG: DUF882 domain-containing protein [Alphaproteobacteria bacterium]|nr:DUF882 domain-containing protein [Alphaproteobacteria bacterium]
MRIALVWALVLPLVLTGTGAVDNAHARGEIRSLSFHHTHSGEDLTIAFKRDGHFDEAALKKLNHFLRDWRTQDETVMDPRLFDILWDVYREVGGRQPIQIVSSYRTPSTNAMLRRRSRAVARHSQHMLGHAIDFFIPGVPLDRIRSAGLRLQRGGVGFYPTSGSPFVHLDTGSVRHWPRMTHDQLVRVLPNERTVHVPSDGVPLRGYDLALADIEKRGDNSAALASARSAGKPALLAAMFRPGGQDEEESEGALAATPAPTRPAARVLQPTAAARPAQSPAASAPPRPQTAAAQAPPAPTQSSAPPSSAPQAATTPGQAAALGARRMLAQVADPRVADPRSPGTTPASSNAMAYAADASFQRPVPAPAGHPAAPRPTRLAADTARPLTRGLQASSQGDSQQETTAISEGESQPGSHRVVVRNARITMARSTSAWLRVVTLAPSATNAMLVKPMGNTDDVGGLQGYFVKPHSVIAITFGDDPTPGMSFNSFSGSAVARLEITSF